MDIFKQTSKQAKKEDTQTKRGCLESEHRQRVKTSPKMRLNEGGKREKLQILLPNQEKQTKVRI